MIRRIANIAIQIDGMTCTGCESRIESKLNKTRGIESAKVSYANASASVTYDSAVIDQAQIEKIIESLDYQIRKPADKRARPEKDRSAENLKQPKTKIGQILGITIIMAAVFLVAGQLGGFSVFSAFPQAEQGMGYGLLFVIGLLTSVHCIAMCGGISLTQCVPQQARVAESGNRTASIRSSLLYNLGRVVSYTVIGGLVGALGSVVSFSGWARGLVALLAGVFMVIMGLNMLNLFPRLRKLSPRLPRKLAQMINSEKMSGKGPLYIGLLNGLMPCGPLQAMQLYALSTGSPVKGALSMLVFSLGTVPLMFGLGALSSLLSKKFNQKMLQVSAVLVVILGVIMFQNGMGLSGLALPSLAAVRPAGSSSGQTESSTDGSLLDGVQYITTQLSSSSYEPITVTAGIPVVWTIQAADGTITGCNNRLIIPAYNIEKKLEVGDNVIEFTPSKTGIVPYSCWMGMIRSQITVVENNGASEPIAVETSAITGAVAEETTTITEEFSAGDCCGVG